MEIIDTFYLAVVIKVRSTYSGGSYKDQCCKSINRLPYNMMQKYRNLGTLCEHWDEMG